MAWIAGAVAGGAVLNYVGTQEAAGQQAEGTSKAAAQQQKQYEQNRSDLEPYREAGTAALTRLKTLLGLSGGPSVAGTVSGNYAGQDFTDEQSLRQAMDNNLRRQGLEPSQYQEQINKQVSDIMGSGGNTEAFNKAHPEAGGAVTLNAPGAGTTPAASGYGDLLKKFGQSDLDSDVVYNSGLQFGLDEGTKALERRAAAGGGYDSGATLKALTRFANDYGSTKAGDAYGRFRDNQDSVFGKLSGTAGMGSGATTVGVNAGTATSSNLSNLYSGLGNAQAAATLAGTNAITGGINSGIGNYYLSQLTPGAQRGAAAPKSVVGGGDF